MRFESCHIEYDLNRRQRIVAHLGVWAPYRFGVIMLLGGSLTFIIALSISVSPWFLLLSVLLLWFAQSFIRGLLNVLFVPVQHMDIIIEENGLGFLAKGDRFWLFLDGIIRIEKYSQDTWTIIHYNGNVINIPVDAIDQRYLDHMQTMARKGKTPEGVQAIIDRGRKIREIEATQKNEQRRKKKKERRDKPDTGDGK